MQYCRFIALASVLLLSQCLFSQGNARKVNLIHTDELRYDKKMVDAQRLIGNVHLQTEGTSFFCDSAYLFANDNFDAFSKIRIVEASGSTVNADYLHFDKSTNTATLTGNVVLRDRDMTLTSNDLTYLVKEEIARYHSGGRIVSATNRNTLTSRQGTYNGKTEVFYFKRDVVLKNPSYTVRSDTMHYKSASEVTLFFGPTTIDGDSVSIYCENGYYDSRKDESRFGKHARVRDRSTYLNGDSIYYNGKLGVGEVFRNVHIRDTTQTFEIMGNYGRHVEEPELSFVTGRALLIEIVDADTLFMHADTLKAMPDTSGNQMVYAYHGVRLFKSNFQGMCDSLVYYQQDSLLWMYKEPILWSAQNQVTGDTLKLAMSNQSLETAWVLGHAFIVSDAEANDSLQGPEVYFNQIKGKNATAHFASNELQSVNVEGNGELVYYPTDDKNEKPQPMGTNQGECSSILMRFKEGELASLRMDGQPTSVFKSNRFAGKEPLLLRDFSWQRDKRPKDRYNIFAE
ncbi:MAG: OstA-like protein [Flavobacteriales bacterium]